MRIKSTAKVWTFYPPDGESVIVTVEHYRPRDEFETPTLSASIDGQFYYFEERHGNVFTADAERAAEIALTKWERIPKCQSEPLINVDSVLSVVP